MTGPISKKNHSDYMNNIAPRMDAGNKDGKLSSTQRVTNLCGVIQAKFMRIVTLLTTGRWINNKAIYKMVTEELKSLKDKTITSPKELNEEMKKFTRVLEVLAKTSIGTETPITTTKEYLDVKSKISRLETEAAAAEAAEAAAAEAAEAAAAEAAAADAEAAEAADVEAITQFLEAVGYSIEDNTSLGVLTSNLESYIDQASLKIDDLITDERQNDESIYNDKLQYNEDLNVFSEEQQEVAKLMVTLKSEISLDNVKERIGFFQDKIVELTKKNVDYSDRFNDISPIFRLNKIRGQGGTQLVMSLGSGGMLGSLAARGKGSTENKRLDKILSESWTTEKLLEAVRILRKGFTQINQTNQWKKQLEDLDELDKYIPTIK